MSKEIDERVVSMQFDNALFEKNIQKSLKSIDDLNKSLNNLDGAKGFDELSKSVKQVDLTPIITSAKNAEKSFSALEIVGITAMSRLTNSLIDFGAKVGKNFWNATIGQIKSGGWKRASDIKAGKFMLEGLGLGDNNVQLLSEAAQRAVKGTAAGLGEAMKAAGVMATSGLKDAQKMEDTLRGIAGVSAMTGRSFENIANIYSTVASNGKLMTMQLRQFSFAGINVAAKLAEAMGTTEEAVNQMVTKGQIDFETFSQIMSDTFGPHALDANKTFEGALANMKAALSRIGESFATPFMDNAKDVFNVLRVFFDSVNAAMAPIEEDFKKLMALGNAFVHKVFSPFVEKITDAEGNVKWVAKENKILSNIASTVRNIYTTIVLIFDAFASAFREVFPPLEDTTETFKDFSASIVPTAEGLKTLKLVFKVLLVIVKQFTDTIGTLVRIAANVFAVIFTVINKLVGSFAGLDDATGFIFAWLKDFKLLETVIDVLCTAVVGLGAAIVGVITFVGDLIKKIGELINFDGLKRIGINIINGIVSGLKAGFDLLKKVWNAIVSFLPETIEKALQIHSPSKVMKRIGLFIMAGLVAGLVAGKESVLKVLTGIGDIFITLLTGAMSFAEMIGTTLVKSFEKLTDAVKSFKKTSNDDTMKTMEKGLDKVNESAKGAVHGFDGHTMYAMESVTVVQEAVKEEFAKNNQEMAESQEDLTKTVDSSVPTLTQRLKQFAEGINLTTVALVVLGATLAGTVGVQLAPFGSALSKMTLIVAGIVGALYLFQKLGLAESLKNFSNSITTFFETVSESAEKNKETNKIAGFFARVVEIFQSFRDNMVAIAAKAIAMSFAIAVIGLIINVTKLVGTLFKSLKELVEAFKNLGKITLGFKETFADKIVKIAMAVAVIAIAVAQLSQAAANGGDIKSALWVLGGIMAVFTTLAAVIAVITTKFKNTTAMLNTVNKTITAFSVMCISLVGLSWIISKGKFDNTMLHSMITVGAILGAIMVAIAFIFRKAQGNVNISVTMRTMLGLAVVISALGGLLTAIALAFRTFNNWGEMLTAGIAISLIIVTTLGMIAVILKCLREEKEFTMTKTVTNSVGNAMAALASLSIFLLAFGAFFVLLSHIKIDNFGGLFTGWVLSLLTLVGVVHVLKQNEDVFKDLANIINSIAGGVIKLSIGMAIIANLDDDVYYKAFDRMLQIVIALQSFLLIMSFLRGLITLVVRAVVGLGSKEAAKAFKMEDTDDLGQTIWGFAIGLASIAAALAILSGIFALMPQERLQQFINWTQGIIILLGAIAVVTTAIVNNGKNDNTKIIHKIIGIAAIIGAIASLLISLVILSFIPWTDLIAPIAAIIVLLGMFALVFDRLGHISKHVKNVKTPLILMSVILGIYTALLVFTSLKEGAVTAAIGVAMGMFIVVSAIAMLIQSISGNLKIDGSVIGAVIAFTAIVGIFMGVIGALTTADNIDAAFSVAAGISAIILSLAGAIQLISGVSVKLDALLGLSLAVAALISISVALGLLKDADPAQILSIAGAISLLMISIGLFVTVLGLACSVFKNTTKAMESFGNMFMKVGAGILLAGVGISAIILGIAFAGDVLTTCAERLEKVDLNKISDGLKELGSSALLFGIQFAGGAIAAASGIAALASAMTLLTAVILPTVIAIGAFLMGGLKIGIASGEKDADKAMYKGCSTLIQIARDVFMVRSPSKVFKWIGDMLMEGLNLGIVQKIPFVGKNLEEGLNGLVEKCYGYVDKFEEVGDEWGNALEVFMGDKFNMDGLLGGMSSLDDIFEKYGINVDGMTEESLGAADALDQFGDSAEVATGKTDTLTDSVSNALDMFTAFNDEAYMTGKDVINTFIGQLEGVSKWRSELESLSSRGLGEVILRDLEALGPQGYEKVHAFYNMTNSELATMNILYKQKLAIQKSTSKAVTKSFKGLTKDIGDTMEEGIDDIGTDLQDNMADLGTSLMTALKKQLDYEKVIDQVSIFRDNVADKIRSSMSIFEAVNEQEEIKAEELLENMKNQVKHVGKWATMITEMAAKGFDEGLVATLTDMGPQSYSKVAAFLSMNEEQIAEANRLFEASERVPEYGADKIVKAFAQAGFTASMGLTDSFLEGLDAEAVERALGDLANTSITTLLDTLNEPMDDLFGIGDQWAGNFASGLEERLDAETKVIEDKVNKIKDLMDYDVIDEDNPINGDPASMYKAYGSKEQQAYRKSAEALAQEQKNREAWDKKLALEQDKIYRNEQTKSQNATASKRRDFTYKVSNMSEKDVKLLDMVKKWYTNKSTGTVDWASYYKTFKYINGGKGMELNIGKLVSEEALQNTDRGSKDFADALREIINNAQGYIQDDVYAPGEMLIDSTASAITSPESIKKSEEAGETMSASIIQGATGGSGGFGKLGAIHRGDIIATQLGKDMIEVSAGASLAAANTFNTEGAEAMKTAGANLADSLITSLKDNLGELLDKLLGSDEVTSPKVKPVLNFGEIRESIISMFKKNPLDLSASANVNMAYKDRDTKVVDAINSISNKDVVDAINQLIDDVNGFRNDSANLRVVMDTGATIGQLGRPMDQYLGSMSLNAGRGLV